MRSNIGLPPLHTCCVCELEIDAKSISTLSLVKGWVKPNGKTLVKIESDEWLYIHDFCLPRYGVGQTHSQDKLF